MKLFRPSLQSLILAALTGAAGLGLSPPLFGALQEPVPNLFAPRIPDQPQPESQEAEKTTSPVKPDPQVEAEAAALNSEGQDQVEPQRALKTELAENPETPVGNVPANAAAGSFAPPLELQVDALGNKTLVIHGDQPPQVLFDEPGGGQVQVLIGDDTAGLIMDNQGLKTLVVRGEPEPPAAETGGKAVSTDPLSVPAIKELPYWLEETKQSTKPYWEAEEIKDIKPYWLPEKIEDKRPYWQVAEIAEPPRPYWLPEPEKTEAAVPEIRPVDVQQNQTAPRPLAAPVASESLTIAYYMYQDEWGVKHLTNIPNDPRYRLFTAVVTVQRGLSAGGPRIRFTHETLRPVIMRAATSYNLDPALIAAVIKSESAFDSRAVSWAGAQGLMQLIPKTAREMGVLDPFDPEDNVMGGSRYLRKMLDQFEGDLTLAVAAYNCGPNRVAKAGRVPDIAETQNYVVIVLRNYERYKLMF